MRRLAPSLAAALGLIGLAIPLAAAEVMVFVAASLSDALKELGGAYEKSGGDKVLFSFAGSNLLARQILDGAPADLFASADEAQMDRVQGAGLLAKGTRKALLSNLLAAVALNDSPLSLTAAAGLAGLERIAMADPRAVPNGIYARRYLEKLGLWDRLAGRVIPTENVRGSLQAVESGNADLAIVYRSDARISAKVRVLFEVPAAQGPAIRFPFAVLKKAPNPDGARRFLEFLSGPQAREAFIRHGFLIPPPKP